MADILPFKRPDDALDKKFEDALIEAQKIIDSSPELLAIIAKNKEKEAQQRKDRENRNRDVKRQYRLT